MPNVLIDAESTIFTTGAFLQPMKIFINGKDRWIWYVTEFTDDSYKDGLIFNPVENSEIKETLLRDATLVIQ